MPTQKKKKTVSNKKQLPTTIFIQIASYRDPELLKTLADCIKNAKHPDNLRFAIAWQHAKEDKWDTLTKYKKDKRFKILDINYQESKGVCWARSLLNEQYAGETYTLQLDSHHRFVKDWDVQMIEMLESLKEKGHKKPVLTGYIPDFFPDSYSIQTRNIVPWIMVFDRFFPEGVVFVRPEAMDDYKERTEPIPSRFMSAHFIFADGKFINEVPYDSKYYFHGEEIDLAIRSYMNGYDLFHPHRVLVWHEYTRNGKKKHWDDHKDWDKLNNTAYKRVKILLGVDGEDPKQINFGKCGLGKKRKLSEFERFCGVEFKTRRFHKHSIEELVPPVPYESEEKYQEGVCNWVKYCIDVYKGDVQENDYDFWCCVFKDENNKDLYRKDLDDNEIRSLINLDPNDKFIHIWREFYTDVKPAKWTIWPHSKSKGWEHKILENKIPYL